MAFASSSTKTSPKPVVVFRTNASPEIGSGHLMRQRVLADHFQRQGAECIMAGPPLSYRQAEDQPRFTEWLPRAEWRSETDDAQWLISLVAEHQACFCVLDDYRVQENYQQELHAQKIRWLQFDGRAQQRMWAPFIVNAMPQFSVADYQPLLMLTETDTPQELLLGPEYALLRSEFLTAPTNLLPAEVEKSLRIYLNFGGGDDRGALGICCTALLKQFPNCQLVVVSGEQNARNAANQAAIAATDKPRVAYHVNPPNVAELMRSCSHAVIGGGTTTYEAIAVGLKMLMIAIADNQITQAEGWHALGLGIYAGELEHLTAPDILAGFNQLDQLDNATRELWATKLSGQSEWASAVQRMLASN